MTVEFTVIPQMTNQFGSLSYGALTTLLTEAGNRAIKMRKRGESVPENMTLYFIKHVQLGSSCRVEPQNSTYESDDLLKSILIYLSDEELSCKGNGSCINCLKDNV